MGCGVGGIGRGRGVWGSVGRVYGDKGRAG